MRVRASGLGRVAIVVVPLVLAGCGVLGDGVSLNGGIFDALGVSDKAADKNVGEPKVPERAGLVAPPRYGQLPPPGSSDQPQSDPQWPVGPEQKRVAAAQAKEAEHAAYCAKELQRKKLSRDLSITEGPLGPCDPSALRAIGMDPNKSLTDAQKTQPGGLPK